MLIAYFNLGGLITPLDSALKAFKVFSCYVKVATMNSIMLPLPHPTMDTPKNCFPKCVCIYVCLYNCSYALQLKNTVIDLLCGYLFSGA